MMKSICILLLFFVLNLVHAQTVTIGHETAPVSYYRIPDQPLDESYKTYSTEISARGGELFRTGLSEGSLESEFLVLSGYQKVYSQGDAHIEATIGEFRVYSEHVGSQQTKSKDKDGNEITKVHYYLELRYSQPIYYQVSDKRGRTLEDEYVYHTTDDQSWRSSNYSSRADLDRYWRSNRTYKLAELQKNRIREGMKIVYDRINNSYGYRLINESERFEKIGRKKHPLYSGYHNAVETIKKAFKLMSADKGLAEIKKGVQPAIEFYTKSDATCKSGTKDEMKLKHIGLYNLALIHFWLENFEEARLYSNAILDFDSKDRDAKNLIDQIEYVEESLRRANRTTRHQIIIGARS